MKELVATRIANAELLNEMYEKGYRYYCEYGYRESGYDDAWSGMPDITNDLYFFDSKMEAEAVAITQKWYFNEDIHAEVCVIPKHSETFKEWKERKEKEKAERKAQNAERLKAKAEKEGLSIEEYKHLRNRNRKLKKMREAVENLAEALAKAEKELAEYEAYIAENPIK